MACLDVRQTLIQQLKGQDLRIPDLSLLFKPWPKDASPCLEGLRTLSGERIASFSELPKIRYSMSKIDVGLFISTWYPGVNLERGDILCCVVLWLFTWDDQIDEKGGHLYDNLQAAHFFRRETLKYVRYCLRLSDNEASHEVPTNYIIAFFKVIGDAVCEAYDYDHRELLFAEIKFFIETSETEQQRRLSPELPSTREYIATRMGTGAVNVCLFFIDYACGVSVPIEALREVEMRTLWDQANILVWAVNDLLSLKKEIAQQAVESIVPLLFRETESLDVAVFMVTEMIHKAITEFNHAAECLMAKFSDDETLAANLKTYTDGCKYICTGNLTWSLQTGRYGVSQHSISGGLVMRL